MKPLLVAMYGRSSFVLILFCKELVEPHSFVAGKNIFYPMMTTPQYALVRQHIGQHVYVPYTLLLPVREFGVWLVSVSGSKECFPNL